MTVTDRQEPATKAEDAACGRGMVIAAGIIVSAFDCPVEAEEILRAAGITTQRAARKIGVDDYDIGLLKNVFRSMNQRTR